MIPYTKETNININIYGKPASGKSTISHFILSFFGNPEFLEGSFTDSDNAIELIRSERKIMPYVLDERMLKVEGTGEKNKSTLLMLEIFREYEGKVKERASKQYDAQSGKRTYSPIISSSAQSMLSAILSKSDLGQFRRFIEIEVEENELFKDKRFAENIEEGAYQYYGYGIELLMEFIFDNQYEDGEYINVRYNSLAEEIATKLKDKQERTGVNGLTSSSKRFALIVLSYEMILRMLLHFCNSERTKIAIEYGEIGTNDIEKIKELIRKNYTSDIEEIIKIRREEIERLLIENLFNKMTQVKVKTNIKSNIINFIEKNKDLFYQGTVRWDGEGCFLGWLVETDDEYKVYVRKSTKAELLMSSNTNIKKDEVLKYIELCIKLNYGGRSIPTDMTNALTKLIGTQKIEIFISSIKDSEGIEYSVDKDDSDLRVKNVRYNRIIIQKKIADASLMKDEEEGVE